MSGITIYEFDALTKTAPRIGDLGLSSIPAKTFDWLESECLRAAELGSAPWFKLTQRGGQRVIQMTSYVGVLRSPDGFQIEVLPKVGKAIGGGANEARRMLIEMLRCLHGFRHIQSDRANLQSLRMPLLDVFVREFLLTVSLIVKRGLRGTYTSKQGNLFALRGKLLVAPHLRRNLFRADRFFTEHDEFSANRPENRLLHSAIAATLQYSTEETNQKLGRELIFAFAEVPLSSHCTDDFQRVQLDKSMSAYASALAWARLILEGNSPLTGSGINRAPSLLFPMEAVFEAFVAKHLRRQLVPPRYLTRHARAHHLVQHRHQSWFQLRPDLVVQHQSAPSLVLDTKWKVLDEQKFNGTDKYGLSQGDFYQLQAYGLSYLEGKGDIVLIFPRTSSFSKPLPPFQFPKCSGLRLWVLPFCLQSRKLIGPADAAFSHQLNG